MRIRGRPIVTHQRAAAVAATRVLVRAAARAHLAGTQTHVLPLVGSRTAAPPHGGHIELQQLLAVDAVRHLSPAGHRQLGCVAVEQLALAPVLRHTDRPDEVIELDAVPQADQPNVMGLIGIVRVVALVGDQLLDGHIDDGRRALVGVAIGAGAGVPFAQAHGRSGQRVKKSVCIPRCPANEWDQMAYNVKLKFCNSREIMQWAAVTT